MSLTCLCQRGYRQHSGQWREDPSHAWWEIKWWNNYCKFNKWGQRLRNFPKCDTEFQFCLPFWRFSIALELYCANVKYCQKRQFLRVFFLGGGGATLDVDWFFQRCSKVDRDFHWILVIDFFAMLINSIIWKSTFLMKLRCKQLSNL